MSHLFEGFKEFDYETVRYNFNCNSCIYNTPAPSICHYEHVKYRYEFTWISGDGRELTDTFPGRKLVDLKKCPCRDEEEKTRWLKKDMDCKQ